MTKKDLHINITQEQYDTIQSLKDSDYFSSKAEVFMYVFTNHFMNEFDISKIKIPKPAIDYELSGNDLLIQKIKFEIVKTKIVGEI